MSTFKRIAHYLYNYPRRQPAITVILMFLLLSGANHFSGTLHGTSSVNLAADIEKARVEWFLDEAFTGTWTGTSTCEGSSQPLELQLDVSSGRADGSIVSSCMALIDSVLQRIRMEGERQNKKLRLQAGYVTNGVLREFGEFELQLVELPFGDNIRWLTIDASPFTKHFPEKMVFTRSPI